MIQKKSYEVLTEDKAKGGGEANESRMTRLASSPQFCDLLIYHTHLKLNTPDFFLGGGSNTVVPGTWQKKGPKHRKSF